MPCQRLNAVAPSLNQTLMSDRYELNTYQDARQATFTPANVHRRSASRPSDRTCATVAADGLIQTQRTSGFDDMCTNRWAELSAKRPVPDPNARSLGSRGMRRMRGRVRARTGHW